MGSFSAYVRQQHLGLVAIFVALSGTAYAAVELEKNDVTSKHIKNKAVKTKDLANNAVTSPKVANGSLLGEDFAAGQLPQGPEGPQGPQGPQGGQGVQGAPGVSGLELVSQTSASNSESGKFATAACPGTKRVVGTGYELGGQYFTGVVPTALSEVVVTRIGLEGGSPPTQVSVGAMETDAISTSWTVTASALCANVAG